MAHFVTRTSSRMRMFLERLKLHCMSYTLYYVLHVRSSRDFECDQLGCHYVISIQTTLVGLHVWALWSSIQAANVTWYRRQITSADSPLVLQINQHQNGHREGGKRLSEGLTEGGKEGPFSSFQGSCSGQASWAWEGPTSRQGNWQESRQPLHQGRSGVPCGAHRAVPEEGQVRQSTRYVVGIYP